MDTEFVFQKVIIYQYLVKLKTETHHDNDLSSRVTRAVGVMTSVGVTSDDKVGLGPGDAIWSRKYLMLEVLHNLVFLIMCRVSNNKSCEDTRSSLGPSLCLVMARRSWVCLCTWQPTSSNAIVKRRIDNGYTLPYMYSPVSRIQRYQPGAVTLKGAMAQP